MSAECFARYTAVLDQYHTTCTPRSPISTPHLIPHRKRKIAAPAARNRTTSHQRGMLRCRKFVAGPRREHRKRASPQSIHRMSAGGYFLVPADTFVFSHASCGRRFTFLWALRHRCQRRSRGDRWELERRARQALVCCHRSSCF